jgi:hypothetical protein
MSAPDGESNPFVVFRKAIDAQASAFIDLLSSTPPKLESPEQAQSNPGGYLDRFAAAYDRTTNPERVRTALKRDIVPHEADKEQNITRAGRSEARRNDHEGVQLNDAAVSMVRGDPFDLLTSGLFGLENGRHWPGSDFFATSPYSPLRLERDFGRQSFGSSQARNAKHDRTKDNPKSCRDDDKHTNDTRWRDAFEDLLVLSQGKDLPKRNGQGWDYTSKHVHVHMKAGPTESPATWLRRLNTERLVDVGPATQAPLHEVKTGWISTKTERHFSLSGIMRTKTTRRRRDANGNEEETIEEHEEDRGAMRSGREQTYLNSDEVIEAWGRHEIEDDQRTSSIPKELLESTQEVIAKSLESVTLSLERMIADARRDFDKQQSQIGTSVEKAWQNHKRMRTEHEKILKDLRKEDKDDLPVDAQENQARAHKSYEWSWVW